MKVLFDVHTFSYQHAAGVSLYIYNLLNMLSRIDRRNSYVVLANAFRLKWRTKLFDTLLNVCGGNFEIKVASLPSNLPRRVFDYLWFERYLPRVLKREKPDLLFAPDFVMPSQGWVRTVATIHDIGQLLFPQFAGNGGWYAFKRQVSDAARWASFLITDSEASARDMREYLNLPHRKVVPIHLAADERFRPVDPGRARQRVSETFSLDRPFVLSVGTVEPRKNFQGLFRAYHMARRRANIPHVLLVAGKRGWKCQHIYRLPEKLGIDKEVRFLGYVGHDDLLNLYNAAEVMVHPSYYEGFGIPVVEAMACGTPVITSNRGAMAEVADDGALLADPLNPDDMCAKILRVISDDSVRSELRSRGLARAALFSWETTARLTLETFERAVAGK